MSRLRRSRSSFHKAQYLRIQAWHLEQVAQPIELAAAIALLDMLIHDYPDASQLAQARQQRARCFAVTGRTAEALEEYRAALDAERAFPHLIIHAYIEFGELVLASGRRDLLEEALSILAPRPKESFPVARYRRCAVAALLNEELGCLSYARVHAIAALSAAAMTESPFRYHRHLGLVRELDASIQARLWRLAGGPDEDPNSRTP